MNIETIQILLTKPNKLTMLKNQIPAVTLDKPIEVWLYVFKKFVKLLQGNSMLKNYVYASIDVVRKKLKFI